MEYTFGQVAILLAVLRANPDSEPLLAEWKLLS